MKILIWLVDSAFVSVTAVLPFGVSPVVVVIGCCFGGLGLVAGLGVGLWSVFGIVSCFGYDAASEPLGACLL